MARQDTKQNTAKRLGKEEEGGKKLFILASFQSENHLISDEYNGGIMLLSDDVT